MIRTNTCIGGENHYHSFYSTSPVTSTISTQGEVTPIDTHASQHQTNHLRMSTYTQPRLLSDSRVRIAKWTTLSLLLNDVNTTHLADFPVGGKLPLTKQTLTARKHGVKYVLWTLGKDWFECRVGFVVYYEQFESRKTEGQNMRHQVESTVKCTQSHTRNKTEPNCSSDTTFILS